MDLNRRRNSSTDVLQKSVEIMAFTLMTVVVVVELGLLLAFFVIYGKKNWWYCWIASDVVILLALGFLIKAILFYDERYPRQVRIKYAWIGWMVYAAIVSAQTWTSTILFGHQFDGVATLVGNTAEPKTEAENVLSVNVYTLTTCLPSVVFFFLLLCHHYDKRNRQALFSLEQSSTMDIGDAAEMLIMLLTKRDEFAGALAHVVLAFVCLQYVLPGFSLIGVAIRMEYTERLDGKHLRRINANAWKALKVGSLVYFLAANLIYRS